MNLYQTELHRIKRICYSNDKQVATVIAAKNFIIENFETDLNLDSLSRFLHTSKFHLLRLFKKYYGLTPKQYLTIKRIEASKRYLRDGTTVAAACYRAGFETPSSFSTLFKSKTGLSPLEFQKSNFHKAGKQLIQELARTKFEKK